MELRTEQRAVRREGAKAAVVYITVAGVAVLLLPAFVDLPLAMAERLALGLQASLPQLVCLMVAVLLVSRGRFHSPADIGGSAAGPPSGRIALRVAFLQNTLEQAVLAVGSNLVLVSLAEGRLLALPVAGALLFVLGRVAFYRGYPGGAGGRAVGMALTAMPSLVQIGVCLVLLVARAF